jgi:hypothetical protein
MINYAPLETLQRVCRLFSFVLGMLIIRLRCLSKRKFLRACLLMRKMKWWKDFSL